MSEDIPVTEARAQFSELINRVGFGKERIVLTRHGKPLVALVPADALSELEAGDGAASTVLDLSSSQTAGPGPANLTIAAQSSPPPKV